MSIGPTASPPASGGSPNQVIIVGAGPAGCSCASWLAQKGISCTLIEAEAQPLPLLYKLDLKQSWVLGCHDRSTADLAQHYRQHLATMTGIDWRLGQTITRFETLDLQAKQVRLTDNTLVRGAALVLATGVRPRRPAPYFRNTTGPQPLDAIALTRLRHHIRQQRVLLLGGGDNAVENALFLDDLGNRVTLWARHGLRAQAQLQQQLAMRPHIDVRTGTALPERLDHSDNGQWISLSPSGNTETFDQLAVLFGFEPEDTLWARLMQSDAWAALSQPALTLTDHAQLASLGIFLAGDLSQRLHPCIQTALADGVTASLQVTDWLQQTLAAHPVPRQAAPRPPSHSPRPP